MPKQKTHEQKESALIRKKTGITLSGFKKIFNKKGFSINDKNARQLYNSIGSRPAIFGGKKGDTILWQQEIKKVEKLMKNSGRKTIKAKDIDTFEDIRYL